MVMLLSTCTNLHFYHFSLNGKYDDEEMQQILDDIKQHIGIQN